ncbi:MAG: SPASM domain-containing protein [Clostridiales bacterium]|nr:SPASM domain-containing protein [Clostridiales bacterium]
MENLSIMIKPASGMCNMRCTYCFYCDITEKRSVKHYGFTDPETMHNIISKAFGIAKRSISFVFQGGEPTLAGLDFYESFVAKVKQLNKNKISVNYALQTNGLDLDENLIEFFAEHKFLLGLSIDGDAKIHNQNRLDKEGAGSHSRAMRTARLFELYGVDYNILVVVTRQTAKHIEKIYNFYKKNNFRHLQFIPCLAPLGEDPFANPYSPRPDEYEMFLKKLFKLYYKDFMGGNYTSIRFFDNLVNIAMGGQAEQCGLFGYCPGHFIIEGDGSVYPCDFYCVDHWYLGNINELDFLELANSEKMGEFIQSSYHEDHLCKSCEFAALCRGGCRRDRDPALAGKAGENIYCDALYNFFQEAEPAIKEIARIESGRQIF